MLKHVGVEIWIPGMDAELTLLLRNDLMTSMVRHVLNSC